MADAWTTAHEIIREYGGYVGTIATAAATYIFKRFRSAEKAAKAAALAIRALREQLEELKKSTENRVSLTSFEDTKGRLDDLRSEILRERGSRHALQKEFNDYIKSEAKEWSNLQRTLGQMEISLKMYLSERTK
jgi:hypothetical protein